MPIGPLCKNGARFFRGLYLIHSPCTHLYLDGLGELSEWSLCFSKIGQSFTPTRNLFLRILSKNWVIYCKGNKVVIKFNWKLWYWWFHFRGSAPP